jgi:tripartite-type tricarboxylate transporter receptor subunit TctC
MRRLLIVGIVATVAAISLVMIAGCGQTAPAPSPTKAAEPTKAAAPAAPTAAVQAAKPTEVPAKTVDFPAKGKTITIICLMNAGGSMDLADRVMADMLTKELGVPVQVVDMPGAGGQVALTQLLASKPDGYTIANNTLPATPVMYLDPDRKATFTHDSFVNLGFDNSEPITLAVRNDSKWKTVQDFLADVKAHPGEIKVSVSGVLVTPHLGALDFMRTTGTTFGVVNFDSGPPALAAMLGGHTEMDFDFPGSLSPALKGNQIRVLGVMDHQPYKLLPGVPTLESLGIKSYMTVTRGFVAPKGTPKEVADVLSAAIKKVATSQEYSAKLAEMYIETRYVDPATADKMWTEQEPIIKQLVDMGKAQIKGAQKQP